MKDLEIMPSALRSLANEIQSPDGIPAMCLRDAADLIEFLERQLAEKTEEIDRIQRFATVNGVAEMQRELAEARRRQGGPDIMDAVTVLDAINGLLDRAGITDGETTQRRVIALIRERDNAISDWKQSDADSIRAIHERNEVREQLAEAREEVAALETRHAATMLHTQAIVDDANALREQRDRLAEAVELGMQLEEPGNIWSVRPDKFQAFLKSAKMAFAAVKGGKDG